MLQSSHILDLASNNIFHLVARKNNFFGCYVTNILKQHIGSEGRIKSSLLSKNDFNYTPIEIAAECNNIEFIKCVKYNFNVPTRLDLVDMKYLNAILSSQFDLDSELSTFFCDINNN